LVIVGPTSYVQLDDGRWTCQEGPPGTWDALHPRGHLEALRAAGCTATALSARRFTASFERGALDAIINPGVSSTWDASADIALDEQGRITRATLRLTDAREPQRGMELTFELHRFGQPVSIDLPPADATISHADHIDELLGD
jgi:hypothetical protein